MSRAQETFKSALWNHAGRTLEYAFMYFTSIVIARGLGVQGNGIYAALLAVAQLIIVLSSFGLEASLNKHIPQLPSNVVVGALRSIVRKTLALRLGLLALVGAILFGLSAVARGLLSGSVNDFLWLLIVYAAARSIVSLLAMVLTAQLKTATTAKIGLASRCVELAGALFLLGNGMTVNNVMVLLVSVNVMQVLALLGATSTSIVGHATRGVIAPILSFGGIFWINAIVDYFLGRSGDVLFLSILLPDQSSASLYDVSFSVAQLASLSLTVGLGGVGFATFARLAIENQQTMNSFYAFMVRVMTLLSVPMFSFLLFNAQSVITVLYSTNFLAASSALQGIVAFRIVARLFAGPENADYLLSKDKVGLIVLIGLAGAAVNVIGNLLLIPGLGIHGAVVASGLANLSVNVLGFTAVFHNSGLRLQVRYWMRCTGACIVPAYVVSLLPSGTPVALCVQVVLFALLLAGMLAMLKPLHHIDMEWFSRADHRLRAVLQPFSMPQSLQELPEPDNPRNGE